MKTNLLEMKRTNFLGALTRLETCPSSKRFCTHGTPVLVMHDEVTSDIFIVGLLPSKNINTKKVLCLLIFANILVLPWGSLAFQFWLKKIPEAIQNSTHHFEDLIKMKTATIVRNHTDVPCVYIDSIHISPVILFPSYLLLTHTSGSKSHAGDSVLDITIFDMSNHQRLSI